MPLPALPAPPSACMPVASEKTWMAGNRQLAAAWHHDNKSMLSQQVARCVRHLHDWHKFAPSSHRPNMICTSLHQAHGPNMHPQQASQVAWRVAAPAAWPLQHPMGCTPLERYSLPGARLGPAQSGAAPASCSLHTAASTPTPRTPRADAPCTVHRAMCTWLPAPHFAHW